jgi:dienelactone hydrolase
MEIPTFAAVSNWLLERGYMVALPLRRGYGETGGPWLENFGSCSSPDYYRSRPDHGGGHRTALDFSVAAADVQRGRILLVGLSAGGWGSLAAASQNPPVYLRSSISPAGAGAGITKVGNCAPQRWSLHGGPLWLDRPHSHALALRGQRFVLRA